ncbi:MAG: C40 family peptidase [Clostridium sp.]|nr:C40 family peptidase [Clostridium sp.]
MAFKDSKKSFDERSKFTDSMNRFLSDEAVFASGEKEADANAKVDAKLERIAWHSASNDWNRAKQLKEQIKEIERIKSNDDLSESKKSDEKKQDKTDKSNDSSGGTKNEGKSESDKKALSKEKSDTTKKAAAKTALSNVFKAKKDVSSELSGTKEATGNAFSDGKQGLVNFVLETLNPMTYIKQMLSAIVAAAAPYVLLFTGAVMLIVIIIAILFQILSPIQEVSSALESFLSMFTIEQTFINDELTDEEIEEMLTDLSLTETQEAVVTFALSRVGYPYSQDYRCSGSYYDCSSLAYYAWQAAGVDISYGAGSVPTAAEEARIGNEKGYAISPLVMQPGDLVFYGGRANGRYLGIYHVAIYIGNGLCVEALNTQYGVVLQDIRVTNVIMVVRPR